MDWLICHRLVKDWWVGPVMAVVRWIGDGLGWDWHWIGGLVMDWLECLPMIGIGLALDWWLGRLVED